ncbi:hypothetical protein MRB53_024871 [Persea americana]|uniref:Uncharacterized protein n=1 Tax=Persea americana TaxID=3435 RepID=A0ACC2LEE9_PERAE|nr:hypothetical protein MRB53_024871 [Persea americana]
MDVESNRHADVVESTQAAAPTVLRVVRRGDQIDEESCFGVGFLRFEEFKRQSKELVFQSFYDVGLIHFSHRRRVSCR